MNDNEGKSLQLTGKCGGKEINIGDCFAIYSATESRSYQEVLSPGVTRKFFFYKTGPYKVVTKHGMVFTLRRVNNGHLIGQSLKAHYDRLEKLTLFEGELRDVVTENPALKQNFRPDRDNVNDVQYNEQDHESTEIKIM